MSSEAKRPTARIVYDFHAIPIVSPAHLILQLFDETVFIVTYVGIKSV